MRHRSIPFVFLVLPLVSACGGSTAPTVPAAASDPPAGASASVTAAGGPVQMSEGGQVTVLATWAGAPADTSFDIQLDTHSVDLDALDLADATLRNDRGEILAARPWVAPEGGHHREGALTFDGDASRFLAGARWIELVLLGVGDLPERTLRWEIGP